MVDEREKVVCDVWRLQGLESALLASTSSCSSLSLFLVLPILLHVSLWIQAFGILLHVSLWIQAFDVLLLVSLWIQAFGIIQHGIRAGIVRKGDFRFGREISYFR